MTSAKFSPSRGGGSAFTRRLIATLSLGRRQKWRPLTPAAKKVCR
jgi:hypothetical protein